MHTVDERERLWTEYSRNPRIPVRYLFPILFRVISRSSPIYGVTSLFVAPALHLCVKETVIHSFGLDTQTSKLESFPTHRQDCLFKPRPVFAIKNLEKWKVACGVKIVLNQTAFN